MGGEPPALFWAIPFALILLQIAVWPLINPKFWEHNYPWLTVPLGLLVVGYYIFGRHATEHVLHVGHEYLSFIALIGSLYVVSGGLLVAMTGRLTPHQNLYILAIGAVLANLVGTTGASMILIRPFMRGNAWRFKKYHIAFFIFIVSNCGGALTPIGDPPLFLGYLRGVPFFWVFSALWYKWALGIAVLLVIFYILDKREYAHHSEGEHMAAEQEDHFRVRGLINLPFLAIIIGAAFVQKPLLLREFLMIGAAVGSYLLTPKHIHERNNFNFHPVQEVAILFFGIFAAMMPALDWLAHNAGQLGIQTATQFYWLTGGLSAVLDNAPTYLNFLTTSMGLYGMDVGSKTEVMRFALEHPDMLRTISIAAVFFGAMTYIGNGPNFMCKAIAEHEKLPTPTFIEYIYKYSLPFLAPVLLLTWFLVI
ncbi:MAG: sodium:proton antiporter [Calditrichaeota bacterium]|nr:sodium:proton antiporter [Calditrichota bacterium]MCB9391480.1 sodium:proton antiporter [Calditrichota bacterium]